MDFSKLEFMKYLGIDFGLKSGFRVCLASNLFNITKNQTLNNVINNTNPNQLLGS